MQCLSASQPTWCADSCRCSTRRHDSSTTCDRTTTSPKRCRQCTGCASQNACSTRSRTQFCMTARHDIWDLLSSWLTYTWSACSAVSKYKPPGHTAHQTVYCWQPCISGCCSPSLERPARGRHLVVITAVLSRALSIKPR